MSDLSRVNISDAEIKARRLDVRRMVFSNLAKGVPVKHVMEHYKLSEKEVMDIFAFVAKKIRSYRFERAEPFANCDTIQAAMKNAAIVLLTLDKLNLGTDPRYSKIVTLDFDPSPGRMSDAELKLIELQTRSHGR